MSVVEDTRAMLEQLRAQMSLLHSHFILGHLARSSADVKRDVLTPLYAFSMPHFEETKCALIAEPEACGGISMEMLQKFHSAILSARVSFLPWQHLSPDEFAVTQELNERLADHIPSVIHSIEKIPAA